MLALESATLGALVAIVRGGVDSGQVRDVEPRTTAAFPLAAADGSTGFHLALGMDVGDDLEAAVSDYVDKLVSGG